MNRRGFIQAIASGVTMMTTRELHAQLSNSKTQKMPVLFIGHGSPMNAIEDNEYVRTWKVIAGQLPKPKAILSISAHWLTHGTHVLSVPKPETIHDFYGFPEALFKTNYPAPGAPELAERTAKMFASTLVDTTDDWGLDHGTWSVLAQMYPMADIPTYQLSIDTTQAPQKHYELASELRTLRDEGVLIIGSGNIVHNLRMLRFDGAPYDWAVEFDHQIKTLIEAGDHNAIVEYEKLGPAAKLAVPTNDHYLPLLYTLGVIEKKDSIQFYNEKTDIGSVSMRSVVFG